MLVTNPYTEPELSILILDFKREKEFIILAESLKRNLKINSKIIYLSNTPNCNYALEYLKNGLIDEFIINKENLGCGVGTRQLFHAAMSEFCLYCQVDQYLNYQFTNKTFDIIKDLIIKDKFFYVDLAGNQGHGRFSERAFIMRKQDYLEIPNIDTIIGSPGPWANYRWGEEHVNEYIEKNRLRFTSTAPAIFGDLGASSIRTYPCGGETLHFTDTKQLWILKPLKQKYLDFPNLKLNDDEWNLVLSGKWVNGTIPQNDLKDSFQYFNKENVTVGKDLINLHS